MGLLNSFFKKKRTSAEIVILLVLIIFIFVAYSNTLNSSFHLDDVKVISNNSPVKMSELNFENLRQAAFESKFSTRRPVALITFALNYYFHQLNVTGYHIVNILVHIIGTLLLYFLLKATLSLPSLNKEFDEQVVFLISILTTAIWALHPLHTQSVTYIVQRMNSMAAMFFIMTMLFYVKARLAPERVKKILFFTISFIAGVLAFGSKENTATLPFFIILYEWYFFQDLRLKISKKQLFWVAIIGGLFVILLYLYLGSSPIDKLLFPDYSFRHFTLAQRLLTQPRVVLHYISLLFYPAPSRLNLDYDFTLSYSLLSPPTTLLAILVIIGLLGLAIYTARKNRLYSFCILWFLGNLVIESSTIPLEIIFEHRTYLPSMLAVLLIVIIFDRTVKNKRTFIVSLVVVSMFFSYWTYERNKVWADELTLYQDCLKKSPEKWRVNIILGNEYFRRWETKKSINHYRRAVQISPNIITSRISRLKLASALAMSKRYQEVIIELQILLAMDPDNKVALRRLQGTRGLLRQQQVRKR